MKDERSIYSWRGASSSHVRVASPRLVPATPKSMRPAVEIDTANGRYLLCYQGLRWLARAEPVSMVVSGPEDRQQGPSAEILWTWWERFLIGSMCVDSRARSSANEVMEGTAVLYTRCADINDSWWKL